MCILFRTCVGMRRNLGSCASEGDKPCVNSQPSWEGQYKGCGGVCHVLRVPKGG